MLAIPYKAIISKPADIEDSVRGTRIIMEEGVRADSFVKIKLVGRVGDVHIGKNSCLNSGVVVYSGNGVDVGEGVLIAANCTLAAVNHEHRSKDKPIIRQGFMPSKQETCVEIDGPGYSCFDAQTISLNANSSGRIQFNWQAPSNIQADSYKVTVSLNPPRQATIDQLSITVSLALRVR